MAQATCKHPDGCDRAPHRNGLCSAHYQKLRRLSLGRCTSDGCTQGVHAAKLCRRHYDLTLAAGKACSVDGCGRTPRAMGLCSTHYYRLVKHGDSGEAELRRKPARSCKVDLCGNPAIGRDDLCRTHLDRLRAYGSIDGRLCACGARAAIGSDHCREHYIAEMTRRIGMGERPKVGGMRRGSAKGHKIGGGYIGFKVMDVMILEHRAVMEHILGRPLEPFENVHHKNGRRADNRPENLELWTKAQPCGQRPEDLVSWVVYYYPDLVEAELRARKREQRSGQMRLLT